MKNIIYCGHFTDINEYGITARKYLQMFDNLLDKKKYNLKIYNCSQEKILNTPQKDLDLIFKYLLTNDKVNEFIKNDYIAIFHHSPVYPFFKSNKDHYNDLILRNAKEKISLCQWETDKIPKLWKEIYELEKYDKIIVPSEWNKNIFEKDIDTPVSVVPVPISEKIISRMDTKIFTVFSLFEWDLKKGYDTLIKAFYHEFYDTEDALLVIKTHKNEQYTGNNSEDNKIITSDATLCRDSISNYGNKIKCHINIKTGIEIEEKIIDIYSYCDVFCLPSRGESFSIPIAQAVMFGIPVITTNIGGHVEYLTDKDNFLVNSEYKPLSGMPNNYLYSTLEMNHVEISYNDLRSKLRKAYNLWKTDKNKLKEIGEINKANCKKILSEKNIYNKFINIINAPIKKRSLKDKILKPINGISFCISTNGKKIDKTSKSIKSIINTANNAGFKDYEIIIAGVVEPFKNNKHVITVPAETEANTGMLPKLRNIAAAKSKYDVIVFLDDDIIFEDDWIETFINYSLKNAWNILGNKILLPNGGRCWDRATYFPHTMVDYDHPSDDKSLYQTGGFWIIRKEVFDIHKWDETITFYASKNGKINEDLEFSKRLIDLGYELSFDKDNTVWHLDGRYSEKFLSDGRRICIINEQEDSFSIKDFSYLDN